MSYGRETECSRGRTQRQAGYDRGMNQRPQAGEYHPQHASYVGRVPDGDVMQCLRAQPEELRRALASLSPEREAFRYAEGKWTIRNVMGHVCDAERVFAYRALCVGRGDTIALPGFEEQQWGATSPADAVPLSELIDQFARARAVSLDVLATLPESAWHNVGNANGSPLTVRGQAWVMAGHVLHHLNVLRERYGVS